MIVDFKRIIHFRMIAGNFQANDFLGNHSLIIISMIMQFAKT